MAEGPPRQRTRAVAAARGGPVTAWRQPSRSGRDPRQSALTGAGRDRPGHPGTSVAGVLGRRPADGPRRRLERRGTGGGMARPGRDHRPPSRAVVCAANGASYQARRSGPGPRRRAGPERAADVVTVAAGGGRNAPGAGRRPPHQPGQTHHGDPAGHPRARQEMGARSSAHIRRLDRRLRQHAPAGQGRDSHRVFLGPVRARAGPDLASAKSPKRPTSSSPGGAPTWCRNCRPSPSGSASIRAS